MLIQLLIGAVVAVGVFFRKIKAQLFKPKDKSSEIEGEN
jgi:hypothetical protein